MNEINCENMLMAQMAEFDGEETKISAETINAHLAACGNCRRDFEQMQSIGNLLERQLRQESNPNLWRAIELQIGAQTKPPEKRKPFVLLAVILVGCLLVELLSEQDFSLVFKLVPLVFITGLFVFLKENPFKISTELNLER